MDCFFSTWSGYETCQSSDRLTWWRFVHQRVLWLQLLDLTDESKARRISFVKSRSVSKALYIVPSSYLLLGVRPGAPSSKSAHAFRFLFLFLTCSHPFWVWVGCFQDRCGMETFCGKLERDFPESESWKVWKSFFTTFWAQNRSLV